MPAKAKIIDVGLATATTNTDVKYTVSTSTAFATVPVSPKFTLDDISQLTKGDKDFYLQRQKYHTIGEQLGPDETTQYVAYRVYNLLNKLLGDRVLRFMGELFQIDIEDDTTLRMLYEELMKLEVVR